jgi:hypothetical protein
VAAEPQRKPTLIRGLNNKADLEVSQEQIEEWLKNNPDLKVGVK